MLARMIFVLWPREGTVSKRWSTPRRLWMRSRVRARRQWRTLLRHWRKASTPVPRVAVNRLRRHSNLVDLDTWEVT